MIGIFPFFFLVYFGLLFSFLNYVMFCLLFVYYSFLAMVHGRCQIISDLHCYHVISPRKMAAFNALFTCFNYGISIKSTDTTNSTTTITKRDGICSQNLLTFHHFGTISMTSISAVRQPLFYIPIYICITILTTDPVVQDLYVIPMFMYVSKCLPDLHVSPTYIFQLNQTVMP